MSPAPDGAAVLGAGRVTGYPRVPVGRGFLGPGAAAYRRVADQLAPGECAAILHWLGRRHLLLATAAGRRRSGAWIARQRVAPSPIESRDALRARLTDGLRDLVHDGGDDDEMALHALVAASATVPAPVRELALTECRYVVVGVTNAGWTAPPLPADRAVIVLAGGVGRRLADGYRHELAHRWHAPSLPPLAPSSRTWRETWAAVREAGVEERARALLDHDEQLAQLCERAWSLAP